MIRRLSLITAAAALAVAAAAQTPTLTVDQIVAKNIQARGSMDKLKAAKTMRVSGKMTIGPGIEAPLVMESKRPNSVRLDIVIQGLTISQAYDGTTGWTIMPLQGNKDPEAMGGDELKAFAESADFDGPLVDYQQKGHKVELLGKEPVEGSDAYKLKVTLKSGEIRYVYLDPDSFLEIKSEGKRLVRGSEIETENVMGDYKEVEGMMIPFSIEQGAKGSPQRQKITIEKVEVNVPIDDARFKMPEVKKPEPPKTEPKPPGR
jgi:hypothetical protein